MSVWGRGAIGKAVDSVIRDRFGAFALAEGGDLMNDVCDALSARDGNASRGASIIYYRASSLQLHGERDR